MLYLQLSGRANVLSHSLCPHTLINRVHDRAQMINKQLSSGRGKPWMFLTMGFSTKAEILLALNSYSLHTMFKCTQKSSLTLRSEHSQASKQIKVQPACWAQFLDHGNSSSVEKVVGKGYLAWAKFLAKNHLDNLPVQVIVPGYWGINIS